MVPRGPDSRPVGTLLLLLLLLFPPASLPPGLGAFSSGRFPGCDRRASPPGCSSPPGRAASLSRPFRSSTRLGHVRPSIVEGPSASGLLKWMRLRRQDLVTNLACAVHGSKGHAAKQALRVGLPLMHRRKPPGVMGSFSEYRNRSPMPPACFAACPLPVPRGTAHARFVTDGGGRAPPSATAAVARAGPKTARLPSGEHRKRLRCPDAMFGKPLTPLCVGNPTPLG